jgi:hypothetical protein
MKQNETHEKTDHQGQIERVRNAQDAATTGSSNPLSRRSFFGRVSASTVVAAAGVGLPSLLLGEKAKAEDGDGDADDASSRRGHSYRIRKEEFPLHRRFPTATRPGTRTLSATSPKVFRTTASVKLIRLRTRPC